MDVSLILAVAIVATAVVSLGWVIVARRFDPHPFEPDRPPWVSDDATGESEGSPGYISFESFDPDGGQQGSPSDFPTPSSRAA